jgi:histidinol-phosphate aminotransferase
MLAVVRGAGLVFLNNPNNPTATVHGAKSIADFVERVRRISPDTVILIDEAYHDYVTDPEYQTAIPLAMSAPNVFVARTFSKAYGMAGMRIGSAVGAPDSVKPLARLKMPSTSACPVSRRRLPPSTIRSTSPWSARATRKCGRLRPKRSKRFGCKPSASQGNFLFVDIGRPAREFRDACAAQGDGRPRLPCRLKTRMRVSIGTMDEMKRATTVFRDVLRPVVPAASGR